MASDPNEGLRLQAFRGLDISDFVLFLFLGISGLVIVGEGDKS
jgi:hypothetical protein